MMRRSSGFLYSDPFRTLFMLLLGTGVDVGTRRPDFPKWVNDDVFKGIMVTLKDMPDAVGIGLNRTRSLIRGWK